MPEPQNGGQVAPQPVDQPKMVPEKDLMAVKSKAEKAEGDLQSVHKELDQIRNQLAQERAAKEQLEAKLSGKSVIPNEEMTALQQKLAQATARGEELETQLLDSKRAGIAQRYSLDAASLKDKSPAQLDAITEALELLGSGARSAAQRFDSGTGGGAAPVRPRDKMKQGIIALKNK